MKLDVKSESLRYIKKIYKTFWTYTSSFCPETMKVAL